LAKDPGSLGSSNGDDETLASWLEQPALDRPGLARPHHDIFLDELFSVFGLFDDHMQGAAIRLKGELMWV
jgi:hypothetical protein